VEIAVSDSGPGVPREQRDLIFELFHRGADGGRARACPARWWRSGRFLKISVATGEQALTIERVPPAAATMIGWTAEVPLKSATAIEFGPSPVAEYEARLSVCAPTLAAAFSVAFARATRRSVRAAGVRAARARATKSIMPHAAIALKQGAGRLIRDETDRGVLMICDPRMLTKLYGKRIWRSLPPMKRTRELDDVIAFFSG